MFTLENVLGDLSEFTQKYLHITVIVKWDDVVKISVRGVHSIELGCVCDKCYQPSLSHRIYSKSELFPSLNEDQKRAWLSHTIFYQNQILCVNGPGCKFPAICIWSCIPDIRYKINKYSDGMVKIENTSGFRALNKAMLRCSEIEKYQIHRLYRSNQKKKWTYAIAWSRRFQCAQLYLCKRSIFKRVDRVMSLFFFNGGIIVNGLKLFSAGYQHCLETSGNLALNVAPLSMKIGAVEKWAPELLHIVFEYAAATYCHSIFQ